MSNIYKATFQVVHSGFLSTKKQQITELYEADSILNAKKQADEELEKARKKLSDGYIPLIHMQARVSLSDIELVETNAPAPLSEGEEK